MAVFTHTMPLTGGGPAVGVAVVVDVAGVVAEGGVEGRTGDGGGGTVGVGEGGLVAPTVTRPASDWIVFAGTPALARSSTAAYGRPPTIFLAVAGPTPGSASRSVMLAVLRSTGAAPAPAFGDAVADEAGARAGEGAGGVAAFAPLTVTRPEID